MSHLKEDWYLTEPIDYELRKYQLLAYLSTIHTHFRGYEVFPILNQVETHVNRLGDFIKKKEHYVEALKGPAIAIDLERMKIVRDKEALRNEHLQTISDIATFGLDKLEEIFREGREIEKFISDQCEISRVGVESIYNKEGYLMLLVGNSNKVPVYRYSTGLLNLKSEITIKLTYLATFHQTISNTLEAIRKRLIRTFQELPSPSTYLLRCEHSFPVQQALLPTARNQLSRMVSKNDISW